MKVSEAKKYLKDNWLDGVRCPCCQQHVKLYRRKITSSMAYSLMLFSQNPVGKFVHAQKWFHEHGHMYAGGGDFPKLRFWGLISKKVGVKEDGNPNSGFYAITFKGKMFVDGEIPVSKYMYIYLDKVRKVGDETLYIKEALGDKFDYDDLMGRKKSPVRELQTQMSFV